MDPELFYPVSGGTAPAAAAKRICSMCPVKDQCLKFALDSGEEWGVWGGASETERRNMRRGRQLRSGPPHHSGADSTTSVAS